MTFIKEGNFYFIKNKSTPYLIASSFESSLKNDVYINKKLQDMAYVGEVYLDMLLTKGAAITRFMTCYFDGSKFDTRKTKILNNSSPELSELKKIEILFCNEYKTLIENSILSYHEKLIAYGKID
jgi:hypothetical protein